ncbi:MAG: hypothetical protein V7K69_22845, partial [Nostoc sp.]
KLNDRFWRHEVGCILKLSFSDHRINHSVVFSKAASLKRCPANQQEILNPYFDHLITQLATFQIR